MAISVRDHCPLGVILSLQVIGCSPPAPRDLSLRVLRSRVGLASYGIVPSDNFRRSAGYVDRILKGEKAGELPVQSEILLLGEFRRAFSGDAPTWRAGARRGLPRRAMAWHGMKALRSGGSASTS